MAHSRMAVAMLALLCAAAGPEQKNVPQHLRLDHFSRAYVVNADLTYVETMTQDTTLLSRRGIDAGEREAEAFYPKSQSLELVEAWVDQPDGTRLTIGPDSVFTRPSAESQSAPGFSESQTTTVLFPQLKEGSKTHVVWKLTQKTKPLLGLQISTIVPEEWAVGEQMVDIVAPESVPLHYAQRGGFAVTETTEGGMHHIHAGIANLLGAEPERNSVSPADYQPMFAATSQPDLASLGAVYYAQSQDRAVVTPAIQNLASKIVGDKHGIEAARAIYNWVALNIRYVAIYLSENDGWVPHPAEEVLAHGYGDCKDHVVITQALLAAVGVNAQAAIIDWGRRFADAPVWISQFNHAIIYLPDYDLYLNPTNPYARFEALDPTLAGKLVVIATKEGRVARTPALKPADNYYSMHTDIHVTPDGTLEGHATIVMSAFSESGFRSAVATAISPEDLGEQVLRATPEGGFGRYTTSPPRDLTQPFTITADWRSRHGTAPCCGKASLPIPLGLDIARPASLRQYLTRDGERRHPELAAAKDLNWLQAIHLPAGAKLVDLPTDLMLDNAAGFYHAHYSTTPDGFQVERRLVVRESVHPPEDVAALEALLYAALDDVRATARIGAAEGN